VLERAARAWGQFERRYQPTFAEPMKLRNATFGWVAKRSARALSSTINVWHQSGRSPASWTSATKRRQQSGVVFAGLTMTGQPVAIAGTT
jgi:hypothetical protein